MAEGQKKRFIGRGMKPRGNQRVKPQEEKKDMSEQSTAEGQEKSLIEPVLAAQEGNETPGNLEPENGENLLQNLENSEATVAQDAGLEAALSESGDVIDAEWPTHCAHGNSINDPCEKCQAADMGKSSPNITAIQDAYGSAMFPAPPQELLVGALSPEQIKEIRESIDNPSKLIWRPLDPALGVQPDGSEKFIITIQEGYTDAVRQWAEADGVAVEQWLSDRLYEYISTYGEPAKGR